MNETYPVVRRLTNQRFLRSHRVAGMAAAEAEASLQGLRVAQEILELAEVPASRVVAGLLDIAEGETVFVRRRLLTLVHDRSAEGTPLQLADSYLPLDIAEARIREADAGPGGTYARIEEHGHTLTRFEEQHWPRPATEDERRQLGLQPGEHVIELHRVAYAGDRAVECFISAMAADRHRFEYDVAAD